jgi:hypothetical protein
MYRKGKVSAVKEAAISSKIEKMVLKHNRQTIYFTPLSLIFSSEELISFVSNDF